jgi:putative lipoprotein
VTYPQRIALPPDAVLEVSLQDISTPGAAAQELGKVTIPTASRQVPIPFEISYDPAEIVDNHTYAVRARILDGNGDLIWTSDTVTPVITNGNPTEDVEIIVVPVQTAVAPDVEFDPNAETAVEAADGAETFNTLLNGLEAAGLAEMLSDPEATFTLFAPTDAAFDALPPEVVAAWDANPARYAEMMSYLVVEGAYAPEDLRDGQVLRSIAGTNIAINKEGEKVFVNGEPTANSVVAGNSVVYALNRVILAPLRPGVVPPLIDEKGVPVFKGPLLTVVGVAQSGKRILLQVDGENFGDIATVDDNDFWLVKQNIDSGVHQILAYMLEDDDTLMAISQLVILPVP